MAAEPTVFVVDDDPAVRESLHWLVESEKLNVETFPSAADFLDAYEPGRPGCLLLDVRMPGMTGLEMQEQLRQRSIDLPTIIITGHADVPIAIKAMKAGAVDFIEKPFNDEALLASVRSALEAHSRNRADAELRREAKTRLDQLTKREHEVLGLVVKGLSNKRIAAVLGISEKTVEVHRGNMMRKMRVGNVAELVRVALTGGI
jgi:FixJ family two-component response regulator